MCSQRICNAYQSLQRFSHTPRSLRLRQSPLVGSALPFCPASQLTLTNTDLLCLQRFHHTARQSPCLKPTVRTLLLPCAALMPSAEPDTSMLACRGPSKRARASCARERCVPLPLCPVSEQDVTKLLSLENGCPILKLLLGGRAVACVLGQRRALGMCR